MSYAEQAQEEMWAGVDIDADRKTDEDSPYSEESVQRRLNRLAAYYRSGGLWPPEVNGEEA